MRSEAAANQALAEMVGRYPARTVVRKPARRVHVVSAAPSIGWRDALGVALLTCSFVAFMLGA